MLPLSFFFNMYHLYLHLSTNKHITYCDFLFQLKTSVQIRKHEISLTIPIIVDVQSVSVVLGVSRQLVGPCLGHHADVALRTTM